MDDANDPTQPSPTDAGQPLTDEDRRIIGRKITQGLHSLREDKGADGEAFMARMDAELAALE